MVHDGSAAWKWMYGDVVYVFVPVAVQKKAVPFVDFFEEIVQNFMDMVAERLMNFKFREISNRANFFFALRDRCTRNSVYGGDSRPPHPPRIFLPGAVSRF